MKKKRKDSLLLLVEKEFTSAGISVYVSVFDGKKMIFEDLFDVTNIEQFQKVENVIEILENSAARVLLGWGGLK